MKMRFAFLALAGVWLIACDKTEERKPASSPPPPPATQTAKPEYATPDSFQIGIGKIYAGYLRIQSSLAHDDFAKAKSEFGNMHAALHALPVDGLDSTAKAQWDSYDARLMKVLHPMSASKDVGEMRNHLADFTPLMLEAIEKFGMEGQGPVYRFHCPMARNNEGADWLQGDKSLENPYYGKTMPHCGSLVDSVKT